MLAGRGASCAAVDSGRTKSSRTEHPPSRASPRLHHPHLRQDVLALPRKHVLEPVKSEVVSHADGGARGIAHTGRAVPLPVSTDTGKRDSESDGMGSWCGEPQGEYWGAREGATKKGMGVPGSPPGSL